MKNCPICWLISKFKRKNIAPYIPSSGFYEPSDEEVALWDSLPEKDRWFFGTPPPDYAIELLSQKKYQD